MDEAKKELKGSPSRDTFKQAHKLKAPATFYACDLDLVLVTKYGASIVAFLDYKKFVDKVQFSEVLAYNTLLQTAPVYIVKSKNPEDGPFYIFAYKSGDWHPEPPSVELELVKVCQDWTELWQWEGIIRINHGKNTRCQIGGRQ